MLLSFHRTLYGTSPYIYPIYVLGGLPEGFSCLCAIHGGTFMLNRDVDGIIYNDAGKACGIPSGNEMARANIIIGDPSYFTPGAVVVVVVEVVKVAISSPPEGSRTG